MKITPLSTPLLVTCSFLSCWLLGGCNKAAEKTAGFSDRLEAGRGLMKIRLGTPISQYPGFTKQEMTTSATEVPEGGALYVYTAKDNKYNMLGPFTVRSYATEMLLTDDPDKRITPAEIAKLPALYLFVYTLNDTICGIKADISNVKDGKSQIFNYYLEEVYGPTMGSLTNPNDIVNNIQTDNMVYWESKSVVLQSKIVRANRYYNGRMLNFDTYNQLAYQWKPAYARMSQQMQNQEAKKKAALQDQL